MVNSETTCPNASLRSVSADERERAWRRLFHERYDAVYRLVLCLGVLPADAEDVLQRVFLVAYRKIDTFVWGDSPAAWINGITVRVVSEYHRWHRVRRVKDWLVRTTPLARRPAPVTPESTAASAEIHELVRATLGRMSPKLRNVLVLLELEDNSPGEVARALRISVNTVRSRRRLARIQFEKLWRKHIREDGLDAR